MNRNNRRVLSEEQVKDITQQVADDLRKYPRESAEVLVNCYLENNTEVLLENVSNWIECAEDEVNDRNELNSSKKHNNIY